MWRYQSINLQYLLAKIVGDAIQDLQCTGALLCGRWILLSYSWATGKNTRRTRHRVLEGSMPSAQPVATSPPDARRWTPTGHCKASQGPCSAVPRRAPCPAGFASVREFRERRETNSAAISAGAVSEKHSSTAPTSAAAASLRAFAQLSTGTRFSSQNFRCSSRHAFILRKAANRSCFAGTQNSGRGLLRSLSEPFEQSASRTWVDQAANF